MSESAIAGVDEELRRAAERYAAARPRSRERHDSAARVMPGGNTRSVLFFAPFPFTVARGEGACLWDVDGHRYADFLGEYTAGLYGHSDPVIGEAIRDALDNGLVLGAHNEIESRLAAKILERFPSMERIRFTNSGTEANLMALGIARLATGRRRIMVFDGAYHGGVLYFGDSPRTVNVPFDFVRATYNDADGAARAIRMHGDEIAAVLVEPMQGAGGAIPATGVFLDALRETTRERGCLLIFDEVMTSRTGAGGAQAHYGVQPDLTTLGKYLGGGLSFGAFGGRADIMDHFDPRRPDAVPHAGTFNNNTLSMCAGLAGLTRIYTPERAQVHFETGEGLRSRLNMALRERSASMQFTGLGSIMNMHPQSSPIRHAGDIDASRARVRDLYFFFMLEHGIYLARRGLISLSLALDSEDLDAFVRHTGQFADRYGHLFDN